MSTQDESIFNPPASLDALLANVIKTTAAVTTGTSTSDGSESAKTALSETKTQAYSALHDLLQEVGTTSVPLQTRNAIDEELVAISPTLKWGLLRGLQKCALLRAYTGLPKTMETTRVFLAGVSAKVVRTYLDDALGDDISRCEDVRLLDSVREVMVFMTAQGRFKRDLGGADLDKSAKQRVRAIANKAKKRGEELRKEDLRKEQTGRVCARVDPPMERDVRVVDAERDERRSEQMGDLIDSAVQLSLKKS